MVQQGPEQRQLLEHPFPLPRRFQQLFIVRAQRLLRPHPVGDVVGDPAHDGSLHAFGSQSVVTLPDPLLPRSCHHRQQSVKLSRAPDLAQIGIELLAAVRSNKIAHRGSQHFFYGVTQQAFKVVDAQQVLAVLH